jgi:hypothetical protein
MALCPTSDSVVTTCDHCDGDDPCEVVMDAQDARDARRFADGVVCGCCS